MLNKDKILEFFFYIAYFFECILFMFEKVYFVKDYIQYLAYFGYFLLIIIFAVNFKYNKKNIIYLLWFVPILITTFIVKNTAIFKLYLLIIVSKSIDFNKILKFDFNCRLLSLITIIFLYFLGFAENVPAYRGFVIRNSYGLAHPNLLAWIIIVLNFEFIMLSNKIGFKNFIAFLLSFFVISQLLDSRASLIVLTLCFVLILIEDKNNLKPFFASKAVKKISENAFLIFAILSFVSLYFYSKNYPIGIKLNEILSNRLFYAQGFLYKYNINLFGNNIQTISTIQARLTKSYTAVLDNGYIHLVLHYGCIIFLFMYLLYKKMVAGALAKNNYKFIIIIFVIMLYGMAETYLFKIENNVFILYVSQFLFISSEKKNNKANQEVII